MIKSHENFLNYHQSIIDLFELWWHILFTDLQFFHFEILFLQIKSDGYIHGHPYLSQHSAVLALHLVDRTSAWNKKLI